MLSGCESLFGAINTYAQGLFKAATSPDPRVHVADRIVELELLNDIFIFLIHEIEKLYEVFSSYSKLHTLHTLDKSVFFELSTPLLVKYIEYLFECEIKRAGNLA